MTRRKAHRGLGFVVALVAWAMALPLDAQEAPAVAEEASPSPRQCIRIGCAASERDGDGCCPFDEADLVPPTTFDVAVSATCTEDEIPSRGHCCPLGREWSPVAESCECTDPMVCGSVVEGQSELDATTLEDCRTGNEASCWQVGLRLFAGSPAQTRALRQALRAGAEAGSSVAAHDYAALLRFGRGVPVDQALAMTYEERACTRGALPEACVAYADLLVAAAGPGDSGRTALGYYARACGQGNALACFRQGEAMLARLEAPYTATAGAVAALADGCRRGHAASCALASAFDDALSPPGSYVAGLQRACASGFSVACRLAASIVATSLPSAGAGWVFARDLAARACTAGDAPSCELMARAAASANCRPGTVFDPATEHCCPAGSRFVEGQCTSSTSAVVAAPPVEVAREYLARRYRVRLPDVPPNAHEPLEARLHGLDRGIRAARVERRAGAVAMASFLSLPFFGVAMARGDRRPVVRGPDANLAPSYDLECDVSSMNLDGSVAYTVSCPVRKMGLIGLSIVGPASWVASLASGIGRLRAERALHRAGLPSHMKRARWTLALNFTVLGPLTAFFANPIGHSRQADLLLRRERARIRPLQTTQLVPIVDPRGRPSGLGLSLRF